MLINEYIEKVKLCLNRNDAYRAKELFEEILRLYKNDIVDLARGTSYLNAPYNSVLNMNFDNRPRYSTEINYTEDLKLIYLN